MSMTPPRRMALIREYCERQGPVRSTLAALWTLLAAVLIVLFLAYDSVHISKQGYQWLALPVIVGVLLWTLFIVEGAELATATLLDKDLAQITDEQAKCTLANIKQTPSLFYNGRQAMVITTIVVLTLIVAFVVRLPNSTIHGPAHLLRLGIIQVTLTFGFPNFIVLWVAQLYPKLLATREPLRRFALPSHQYLIKFAMALERRTNIGAPTTALGMAIKRTLLGSHDEPARLAPSRTEMYRSLATFAFTFGVETMSTDIEMSLDGAVRVTEDKVREVLSDGTRFLRSEHYWGSGVRRNTILYEHSLDGTQGDSRAGILHWELVPAEIDGTLVPNGKLQTRVEFAEPLKAGTRVNEHITYRTEPAAMKMGDQEEDSYSVTLARPVHTLILRVRPADAEQAQFTNGRCSITGVDFENEHFETYERNRCALRAESGGYSLTVEYPVVGSKIVVAWRVNRVSGPAP